MISSGYLTEVVTLKKNAYTRNDAGEQIAGFANIRTIRANVKFSRGSKALSNGEVWNPTTIVITCRYAEAFMPTSQVVWLSRKYEVESLNPDRINGSITITATLIDEGQL